MARRKDVDWCLREGSVPYEQVHAAVLMDIRDELKQLNQILSCPNFLAIPEILRTMNGRVFNSYGELRQITRNTTKRKYVRKVKR